jgi:hypothetical protein
MRFKVRRVEIDRITTSRGGKRRLCFAVGLNLMTCQFFSYQPKLGLIQLFRLRRVACLQSRAAPGRYQSVRTGSTSRDCTQ